MIVVKTGNIIDPLTDDRYKGDVIIGDDGKVADIVREGEQSPLDVTGAVIIDASGLMVSPGLVDGHVHFRDPGQTAKEDIITGAAAAAAGGFTTVVMMGNTIPAMDNKDTISYVLDRAAETGIRAYACGNVTKGMAGRELADLSELSEAGAVLFTDDGKPLTDKELMLEACRQAAELGKVVSLHEENPEYISENGVNAGEVAAAIGLKGSDRMAEISMVKRDIDIARQTGCELTIQHISTAEAVDLVRKARAEGLRIHAEATPHHFSLTQDAVLIKGTLAKMNPPLRLESDRQAIIEGLRDGSIDMIATDHAPHTMDEKKRAFKEAPSGIIGLETALSLGIRELVNKGYLTMPCLIRRMTEAARVYGLKGGRIEKGREADIVIFDPEGEWTVPAKGASKATNSPFIGEKLPGVIRYTICEGKIIYRSC
ncbi:dihydroorotase [Butyrivibrio sp. MC2013]|uniref:dihydroorotase n=1 Tax=Butyrivibrio sp. MC2013 TaxID=1280686 RepID=UPI0004176D83|nr:dihydroorotase [Butyrivibrio sp. MC2013]